MPSFYKMKLFQSILYLIIPILSCAQDTINKSILLNQIVLTGQYTPIHIDSSFYAIEILNVNRDEDIFGAQNLSSVMSRTLGLNVFHDPFLGSSIDFQGFSGENIKVLIDGIEVSGLKNGSLDFSQINLTNIERIELVDGPLSTVYGNNALGATINLISKNTQPDTFNLGVETYLESIGQYNLNINSGYKFTKGILFTSLGRHYFDGWSMNDPVHLFQSSIVADSSRFLDWKPKEQWFVKSRYNYKTSKQLSFQLYVDIFKEEVVNKGFPQGAFMNYAFDDYYFTRRFNQGLSIKGPFLNRNIDVVIYYNNLRRIKNQYYTDLSDLSQLSTNDSDTTIIDVLNHRVTCSNLQNLKLNYQYGYMINYESMKTQRITTSSKDKVDISAFSSLDYDFRKVSFRTSIRYVYNNDGKNSFAPSVNFKFKHRKKYLRGSYGRGFRTPSLKEMYFNFVDINHNIQGNPSLQPEYSHNFQINIHTQFSPNFQWDAKIFYNSIDNYITLTQNNNLNNFEYSNIDGYNTAGCKIGIDAFFLNSQFEFNIAYLGQNSLYQSKFKFYPTLSTLFNYSINTRNNISLFYSFKGSRSVISKNAYGELISRQISQYSMLDMSYNTQLFNEFLKLSIGCNNILNIRNLDAETLISSFHNSGESGIPISCGRYVFTSLKFNL